MLRSLLPAVAVTLAACAGHPVAPQPFTSGAEGFDTTTWWLDTGEEVVVFDAQFTPALAEQMLADIRSQTDSPVRWVVVTHPNPDKFNGATVFQAEGAELVASAATAAAMPEVHAYKEAYFTSVGMFEPGTYPPLPTVDRTFEGALTLELAGADLELVELSQPGVSSTQTVARVGEHVVVGDLVAGGVHAWLEGGIVDGAPRPDLQAWDAALTELHELVGDEATVYPGRGAEGPARDLLPAQQAYLATMDALVAEYVHGLDDPASLAEEPDAHWAAITALAEEALPDHGLSYLVTYGVYGLAFRHAAGETPSTEENAREKAAGER